MSRKVSNRQLWGMCFTWHESQANNAHTHTIISFSIYIKHIITGSFAITHFGGRICACALLKKRMHAVQNTVHVNIWVSVRACACLVIPTRVYCYGLFYINFLWFALDAHSLTHIRMHKRAASTFIAMKSEILPV